jgi:UDP-N-acetylmuramoyl-tripeptide--D-alanyl-D-alanine ligase
MHEHLAIGRFAEQWGIEIVAVGTDFYGVESVANVEAVLNVLPDLGPGDAVLVKGSRVAGLERLAAALLAS